MEEYPKIQSIFKRDEKTHKFMNPEDYWHSRLEEFGLRSLRGVGKPTLVEEENEELHSVGKQSFLDICTHTRIDFETKRILDIGCGVGYYTQLFRELGVKSYLGIDITDVFLGELGKRFPDYRFRKQDITVPCKLGESFDLLVMIDVTQHIISDKDFAQAMENVKQHLGEGGIFIVTDWLSKSRSLRKWYDVRRPLKYYQNSFRNGYYISTPISFRDKYIFWIKRK